MAGSQDALYLDILDRLQSIDSASPVHVQVTRVITELERLSEAAAAAAFSHETPVSQMQINARMMFYRDVNQVAAGAMASLLDALMHSAMNDRGEERAKLQAQRMPIIARGNLKPID